MLQGEHSAILLTFIKLPFVIKIFILSIFEWPFYTGFTVIYKPFSLLFTKTVICFLFCLCIVVAYITNNMDPDQTDALEQSDQGSKCCFCDKIPMECI